MANHVIPKARINSQQLLFIMRDQKVSIRELGRRQQSVGYSERQIRAAIKEGYMGWNMVLKICKELNLIFATRVKQIGESEVYFYTKGSSALDRDILNPELSFWTSSLDISGFEYPTPYPR